MQCIDTRVATRPVLSVAFRRYANQQVAIVLSDAVSGDAWAVPTVSVPAVVERGCVALKNYCEHEGIDQVLLAGGVIEGEPVRFIPSGYVCLPVYRLSAQARREAGL